MEAIEAAKERSRAVWSAGDYASVAEKIGGMGKTTVELADVGSDQTVLDVACGAGNATLPAARRGASVTGLDIVPELMAAGRRAADEEGLQIDWIEGDAESLPFEGESFDVIVSTVGIMFAPRHSVAAEEAARVLRPGGRLAIASWTPDGTTGQFFKTVAGHMPPPPEGFQSPILWGTEQHVRELFERTGIELDFREEAVQFEFDSPDEAVEMFETKFGPVITARAALEPQGKWEALRSDLRDLFESFDRSGGSDGISYPGEYLVALGRKGG